MSPVQAGLFLVLSYKDFYKTINRNAAASGLIVFGYHCFISGIPCGEEVL